MKTPATLLTLLLFLIVPAAQADEQALTVDESNPCAVLDHFACALTVTYSASMVVGRVPCGNSYVGVYAVGLCVVGVDPSCSPTPCLESDLW